MASFFSLTVILCIHVYTYILVNITCFVYVMLPVCMFQGWLFVLNNLLMCSSVLLWKSYVSCSQLSDKVDLSIVLGPRGLFSIQFGMYAGVILVQKKLFNNSAWLVVVNKQRRTRLEQKTWLLCRGLRFMHSRYAVIFKCSLDPHFRLHFELFKERQET